MGWLDWMDKLDPMQLSADQVLPTEPMLPQQEKQILSPADWMAQQNNQQYEQNQQQQVRDQMPVEQQIEQIYTPEQAQQQNRILSPSEWMATQPKKPSESDFKLEDTTNLLYKAGQALYQPAATALEAISYLDKPRGALAGGTVALQNNTPLWEGIKKGADENTSWKETFNQDWVKDNPKKAAVAGLATDIFADPMWLATPAKAMGLLAKGSKAIGVTDKYINPAVKAISETETGKKAIALGEDVVGKNRIAEVQFDFNAARAKDQVEAQDYVDLAKGLKKDFPSEADKATDYIQASPRGASSVIDTNTIVKALDDGTLLNKVQAGGIPKQHAFEALRNANKEIPDYLLQDTQRLAKEAKQAIPDTVYRDQILGTIPNVGARKAIQYLGDKFATLNKQYGDKLVNTGRLSTEQNVRFMDGEHLRRSLGKWENPEKFLKDLKSAGKQDEWEKAFLDYQGNKAPGAQGYGAAHKVDTKDFIGRQNLSDETLKKLGLVTDPEYRIMDTINRGSKTLREDEFLTKVDTMWGKTDKEAAKLSFDLPDRRKYVKIPDTAGYGALAGRYVPKDIGDQVLKTTGTAPDNINKTWQKMVSWWKVEKLANPASTMRNFYSGIPMANVNGAIPFQSLPKYVAKVTGAYATGGKNHPLMRQIRESGILDNGWNRQEMSSIIGENPKGIAKWADKGMEAFGAPDKFWKAVVYAYHIDNGKTSREAAKIANKALLDYSAAPDWVNTLSKSGAVPFIKFPLMAGEQTAKALYSKPAQVTKYTKAQNQVNSDDRNAIMPDYMKSKTLLPLWNSTRTVNGKPQKVQNNLDLSYILPFASDVKMGNPVTDALQLMATGRNGLNMEVINDNMTPKDKVKAYAKYAFNSFGPSIPLPGNYAGDKLENGWKGNTDSKGRQFDLTSAASQVFLGAKNVPINIEEIATQKVKSIEYDMRDTKGLMKKAETNKNLTDKQKEEQKKDYQKQYDELGRKLMETKAAFKREKQRGSQ